MSNRIEGPPWSPAARAMNATSRLKNAIRGMLVIFLLASICIIRPLMLSRKLNTLVTTTISPNRQIMEDNINTEYSWNRLYGSYKDTKQRAMFIICMGETAVKSKMVERFVYSARHVGMFPGWIVLLTDAPSARYETILHWSDQFAIIHPDDEDYDHSFKATAMKYKQFKTYVLQYLAKDTRLDDIELVYYLDVDTVFGNPVWPLFHGLETKYQIGPANSTEPAKMWMFDGNYKSSRVQGGQMVLDRATSQPCLDKFRSLMNPETSTFDQNHLMQMYIEQVNATATNDGTSLQCKIILMKQEAQYIRFPGRKYVNTQAHNIRNGTTPVIPHNQIPILNHFKNTGRAMNKINSIDWETYMRYILRFEDNQSDMIGITSKMFLHKSVRSSKNILDYDDEKERALFVISMGQKAANSTIVERFVWSARNLGKYNGWIIVLTDAPTERYSNFSSWTDNVIFMEPDENDIKTHYKTPNMVYKRFKTLVLDYISKDSRLDRVELVYYLDVDIVFAKSVWPFFHGLEEKYEIGPPMNTSLVTNNIIPYDRYGTIWMFEGNNEKWPVQGGQMILDRRRSQKCLQRWRDLFDRENTTTLSKDQWLLAEMLESHKNATGYDDFSSNAECEIVVMKQKPFLDFPSPKDIRRKSFLIRNRRKSGFKYSPLVHIRNDSGTKLLRTEQIVPFMRDMLKFKEDQVDDLGILNKIAMESTKKENPLNRRRRRKQEDLGQSNFTVTNTTDVENKEAGNSTGITLPSDNEIKEIARDDVVADVKDTNTT